MSSDQPAPPSDQSRRTDAASENPSPVARRAFLRSFSRDAANAAIQAAGVAVGLQRATGDAIGSALGIVPAPTVADPAADTMTVLPAAPDTIPPETIAPPTLASADPETAGAPRPYRVDGESLLVLDQRGDPRADTEIRCETLSDVAAAMRERRVHGPALLAELTGFGLWLSVLGVRGATLQAKRTRMRTSGAVLRGTRNNVATIDWTVDRMVAAWDAVASTTSEETELEHGMLAAAEAVAALMRARMAGAAAVGADEMPDPSGSTFGVMTLGSTGYETEPVGGGASGIVARLVERRRNVRAWVLETRPLEDEAYATARALAASGADTTVVADATAGWLLASRSVDAVVIGADRITSDGAVTSVIGTYGLATLARRHGVPCFAIATTSAIDLRTRDPDDPGTELEPFALVDPGDPTSARVASTVGTRGPLQDITPADLLTAIVTEWGVLRPPYDEAIARALDHEAAGSA